MAPGRFNIVSFAPLGAKSDNFRSLIQVCDIATRTLMLVTVPAPITGIPKQTGVELLSGINALGAIVTSAPHPAGVIWVVKVNTGDQALSPQALSARTRQK